MITTVNQTSTQSPPIEMHSAKPIFRLSFFYAGLAILITSLMDYNGLIIFSALPLIPLLILFKYHTGISFRELGFTRGRSFFTNMVAILYPILVMTTIVGIMLVTGGLEIFQLQQINWSSTLSEILLITITSLLFVILTEEGFFRGAIWTGLKKTGVKSSNILLVSSLVFSFWHISLITSATDYRLEGLTAVVYLTNATLLGLIWGLMRRHQGSLWAPTISHSLWNAIAYTFFGFGSLPAILDYDASIYSPETGYVGLIMNIFVFFILSRALRTSSHEDNLIAELHLVEGEQIQDFSSYFEGLDEFEALVFRNMDNSTGKLFVDNPDSPQLLIYQAKMLNVILDHSTDSPSNDTLRMVQRYLRTNKILVTNRETWKAVFRNQFSGRTISMPQQRNLFTASDIDRMIVTNNLEKISQKNIAAGYLLRPLVDGEDVQVNSKFKRYYDMVDPVSSIIETQLLFGVFTGDNFLVGLAGPAHVPSQNEFEVQIVVDKNHRRRGLATWLASALVSEALERNMDPVWDAENPESAHLARKLDYTLSKEYHMEIYSSTWIKMLFSLRVHLVIGKMMGLISKLRKR